MLINWGWGDYSLLSAWLMWTVELNGLHFAFINLCELCFPFFAFPIPVEQVPIDLKNLYVNLGCWAHILFHGR